MTGSAIQRQLTRQESACFHPEAEIHQYNNYKTHTDNCRPPFFVVDSLDIAALADLIHTPDVQHE